MSESLYEAVSSRQLRRNANNKIRHLLGIPLLMAIDLLAVSLSLFAAALFRDSILQPLLPTLFRGELLANTISNIWWLPLVVVFCLIYENLYQKRIPFWIEAEILFKAVTVSVFLTIARSGFTGLLQVSGRNRISFFGRVKLDSWYMKNWSPWLDLLILFRTRRVVITADGAY